MNILILSRNAGLYSTQSLFNACKARGHQVWILDHQRFDLQVNGEKLDIFYSNYPISQIDAIIPRIGATSTQYGAAVIRHFEMSGVYSMVPSEALLKARDKFRCMQIMAYHKIPTPKTLLNNGIQISEETIKNQFIPPFVMKMKESTHGLGVLLMQSFSNAMGTLETFHHLKQEALIQEFVAEAKGTDLRIFIVDDTVAGAMRREAAEGDFRSNLHRGGKSFLETLTLEEIQIARKAARVLGLKVAGVDLLRSAKGPLVLEVNASPGLEGIEGTTGINIAAKIIHMIEKEVYKGKNRK
jgi:ribosomal protein S6--L-glutamate ligase